MSWIHILLLVIAAAGAGRLSAAPSLHALRTRNRLLELQARRDHLTGVLNRAGFEAAYAASAAIDRYLILVDLNTFKEVNDAYGHPAGDQVLAAAGIRLADLAEQHHGWAARLGGDEFAVLLPTDSWAIAEGAASVAAADITVTNALAVQLSVSGSAGIAAVAVDMPLPDALVAADIALYHAKGLAGVATFKPGMTYPAPVTPRRRARDVPSTS